MRQRYSVVEYEHGRPVAIVITSKSEELIVEIARRLNAEASTGRSYEAVLEAEAKRRIGVAP